MNVTFMPGVTYGVDDLNGAIGRLTGCGIAPFLSKDSYDYEDLNAMTSAVTASGVSLGGLSVSLSQGTAVINKGICYFENGVTAYIESEESIPIDQTKAQYIYAVYDITLKSADIVAFDAPWGNEDTGKYAVALAKTEGGSVTDMRSFARSKVATFGSNKKSDIIEVHTDKVNKGDLIYTADISGYNFAIFTAVSGSVTAPYIFCFENQKFLTVSGGAFSYATKSSVDGVLWEVQNNTLKLTAASKMTYFATKIILV